MLNAAHLPSPRLLSPQAILLVAESEAYEFVLADQGDIAMVNARKVFVASQDAASALFPIRLLALGEVEIAVDAISAEATYSLIRGVLVKVWRE